MLADLLNRKRTHFVLWRPRNVEPIPTLYIGQIDSSDQPLKSFQEIPLKATTNFPELWEVEAEKCHLDDGKAYHYWFKVANSLDLEPQSIYCSDPTATTIDRRFLAPITPQEAENSSGDPASVILYQDGQLFPCDPNGQIIPRQQPTHAEAVSGNNHLVIYKLPLAWTYLDTTGEIIHKDSSFQDILSLFVADKPSPNFANVDAFKNRAHLEELGINCLELSPITDSKNEFVGGYQTTNYFAADFKLGFPHSNSSPTAGVDLATLIQTCHQQGVRFFLDLILGFADQNPYQQINYLDFFVALDTGDPEEAKRDASGGDLFKYNYWVEGYNPVTGGNDWFVPAREYLKIAVEHWLNYYQVDGLRISSIANIDNYDFVQNIRNFSRLLWEKQGGERDRFLVVGEESTVPVRLIHQNRVDALGNGHFKRIVRKVILGEKAGKDASFEWSIRKLIDCRFLGFLDTSQAINYLTSPNIGEEDNERFYDYLVANEIYDAEPRIKLAFVCLLTAVGIPMILAGEEFGDQDDLDAVLGDSNNQLDHKQVDPVNYSRLEDDWRKRVFEYVARLVAFRKASPALGTNDVNFVHADFHAGKRVVVWRRGKGKDTVVVVANFSDYGTPDPISAEAEYVVANWAKTPEGMKWYEVTQGRTVLPKWVGREPIFPWEAKVYTLVSD